MSTPLFDRLRSHCQRLRLHRLEAELPTLLEQAAKREVPYSDFLDELLALEIRSKSEKHLTMRISMARFPFQKTLDAFDFKFQPSIDPKVSASWPPGGTLKPATMSYSSARPASARRIWPWPSASKPVSTASVCYLRRRRA